VAVGPRDGLAEGLRLHQAGDLAGAIRAYEAVLAEEREQADAMHLLGVARHQQGDHAAATDWIGKAVALKPGAASFHANLAEAYRALGKLDRAVACCRMALQLWPDFPEARNNLGLALQGLGKLDEAVAQFRAAVALRPADALSRTNLGNALRTLGDKAGALECFRKAVDLDPRSAAARTNLGQFLLDLGRAEEALPHCREAVASRPDLPEAHNNLGNAERALGRLVEARACYLEALRLDPDLPRALANVGLTLQLDGRPDEALPWLRRAVELEPGSVESLALLAEALTEDDRQAEAIDAYEQLLALEPDRPAGLNALGWLLQDAGRAAEAREKYEAALRLRADFAPAVVSLGGLDEERGELAEAEARFREAIRLQPDLPAARARLATLLRGALPAEDVAALERRLEDPDLADGPRADLLFGLAHVRDGLGEYDRAADCLRRANALALARHAKRSRRYDPDEHSRFVDGLIAAFGPATFERLAGAGSSTRRPVFIVGLPRSGTTLIEQVLAGHSRVLGAGELTQGRRDFEAIPAVAGRSDGPLACVADLDAAGVAELARRHEEALSKLDGGRADRVVDKMPDNSLYVGLLTILFPGAVVVHCRRELRDVAVSCWMTNFRSIRWANDPGHVARRFADHVRVMDHWRRTLPRPMVEVDYEEAVADIEGVARRLLDAIGLEFEPSCLEFHRAGRPVRTASVVQVRRPVYRTSVGRWTRYHDALGELFATLANHVETP
jgi:tetratricopeptide (TPR) repeat protein